MSDFTYVANWAGFVYVAFVIDTYLPPYSPDLNPIEQVFAKLKALLRKAAARTRDALWDTNGQLLDAFPPQKCQNYIVNSGYAFD